MLQIPTFLFEADGLGCGLNWAREPVIGTNSVKLGVIWTEVARHGRGEAIHPQRRGTFPCPYALPSRMSVSSPESQESNHWNMHPLKGGTTVSPISEDAVRRLARGLTCRQSDPWVSFARPVGSGLVAVDRPVRAVGSGGVTS